MAAEHKNLPIEGAETKSAVKASVLHGVKELKMVSSASDA
jgi:hypothetical protein